MGFRSEQLARGYGRRRAFSDAWPARGARSRSRQLSGKSPVPPPRAPSFDSTRHHHGPLPLDVRGFCRRAAQLAHGFPLPRLRGGITPELDALSTLIFAVSVALIVIWYHLRSRSLVAAAG